MWTLHANHLTPAQVAQAFISNGWPGRLLDESSLFGEWRGKRYTGRFQLLDGVSWYRIDSGATLSHPWTIEKEV